MNSRLLLATLLGVIFGAAAVSVSPLHSAPAPESRAQRWEYKIVYVSTSTRGETDPADKLTEQFNTLAKDGWEYHSPVAGRDSRAGGPSGGQYVCVPPVQAVR